MRYDTKAELLELVKVEDGLGGYGEHFELLESFYVNKSNLSFELAEKLFGKVSMTALNCVVNKKLSFKNNADVYVVIEGRKYDIVTYKSYRNKTHLYLEVMDNEHY